MKEYEFSVNNFNQPVVLKDKDAIYINLIRLFLLEPGTYQTNPDMGIGLISRYRYSDTIDLESLKSEAQQQIETYLPDLVSVSVDVSSDTSNGIITIQIYIESTLYELAFNTSTLELSSLN